MAAKKEPAEKSGSPEKQRSVTDRKQRRETGSRNIDQRVIKAIAHPLRVEILAILNDRMASPNELSKELEEGLSQVSYHVKCLKDFEMIEMVKTEPRRGAVEHYYRANEKVFIPSWVLKLAPPSAQRSIWGDVLADIEQDVTTSLETGTFDKRLDLVVGRDVRILDGKAREDTEELAAEFYERFEAIEGEAVNRRAKSEGDGEAIPTTAAVLVFGSAEGKNLKPIKGKRRKKNRTKKA
ncbi:MAG TPA: ArsR family transcriptional regulator [Solirubrobacterales bacterium]|nr:ArsR family transcriptional regulator [Solirubrobacterales bacterium]